MLHAVVRARARRALARAPPPARYPFPYPSLSRRRRTRSACADVASTRTPRVARHQQHASRRPYHQATAARAPRPSQHGARASIHGLARRACGCAGPRLRVDGELESPIHHPFTRFQTHVTWLHVEGQRAGERMGAGSGWAGADHTHAWGGRLSFERVGGESPIHHPFTRFQTHVTWLRVKGQHAGWAGVSAHTRAWRGRASFE